MSGADFEKAHAVAIDALEMAVHLRRPIAGELVHHTDRGSQYTSFRYTQRLADLGIAASVGSVADAYDNAMAESFFASLECELIDRRSFKSKAEARTALFTWIEGWYNPRRRHSGLGQQSPMNFEKKQQERIDRTAQAAA